MDHRADPELSAAIKRQANYFEAPPELRSRIAAAVREAEQKAPASRGRWMLSQWLGMGAAFAFGVIATWAVTFLYVPPREDRLAEEVISGHVRSLMTGHLIEVASSDRHTVKPWFNGKLDFSPPVHDLTTQGFPLVGGRLDYLDQRPGAALVYRHRQHYINLFVWPLGRERLLPQEQHPYHFQGFSVIGWNDAGLSFWAVSDLDTLELQDFVRAFQGQAGGAAKE